MASFLELGGLIRVQVGVALATTFFLVTAEVVASAPSGWLAGGGASGKGRLHGWRWSSAIPLALDPARVVLIPGLHGTLPGLTPLAGDHPDLLEVTLLHRKVDPVVELGVIDPDGLLTSCPGLPAVPDPKAGHALHGLHPGLQGRRPAS